jgi:hypothetical protein
MSMEYNSTIRRRIQLTMNVTNVTAEGGVAPYLVVNRDPSWKGPVRDFGWLIVPGPVDIPGMAEWLILLSLCRYWCVTGALLRWSPQNLQKDGRMWVACTLPRESTRFTNPGLIRAYHDS